MPVPDVKTRNTVQRYRLASVDEVQVLRAVSGCATGLTFLELRCAIEILERGTNPETGLAWSARRLALHIGTTRRTIVRHRRALRLTRDMSD